METSTDFRPTTRTPYFALPLALSTGATCGQCTRFRPINIMPSAPGRCSFRPGIIGREVAACNLVQRAR